MHKAVCSNCGKTCEVPFKPTNGKPVYCKECFDKMGGASHEGRDDRNSRVDRGNRNNYGSRPEFKKFNRPESRPSRFEARAEKFGTPYEPKLIVNNNELKQQLELINSKLDKLISIAEKFFSNTLIEVPVLADQSTVINETSGEIVKKVKKLSNK